MPAPDSGRKRIVHTKTVRPMSFFAAGDGAMHQIPVPWTVIAVSAADGGGKIFLKSLFKKAMSMCSDGQVTAP
jgi:hypothetical protein